MAAARPPRPGAGRDDAAGSGAPPRPASTAPVAESGAAPGSASPVEPTVGEALRGAARRLRANGIANAEFDARLLLRFATGWSAAALLAERRARFDPEVRAEYDRLVAERAARRPLQHLTGTVEFHGLPLAVGPEALLPRPETETLVEAALEFVRNAGPAPTPSERPGPPPRPDAPLRLADVGCGAGPIALALAAHLPEARVTGFDSDPAALQLAAENRQRHGLERRVSLAQADLLTAARPGAFRVIATNLPYVPTAEIETLEPEVRDHEPRRALDGGPDGLEVFRRFLPMARRALAPGGRLFLEIGAGQREGVARLLDRAGFRLVETRPDLAGIPRVLAADAETGSRHGEPPATPG